MYNKDLERLKLEIIEKYHWFMAKANTGTQVDYDDILDGINQVDVIEND